MEKNKTAKYFKYAIGEIILVVIGILIALSINNWNENRKTDKQIELLLNSLVEAIKQDTVYLKETAHLHEFRSNSLAYLLRISESAQEIPSYRSPNTKLVDNTIWNGAYPDTLNADFVNKTISLSGINEPVTINKNVLDELKNSSLYSALKKESLKASINSYYNFVDNNFLIDDWNEHLTSTWREFLRDKYGILSRLNNLDDPMNFIREHKDIQLRIAEMIGPAIYRTNNATKAITLAEDVIKEIENYQSSN